MQECTNVYLHGSQVQFTSVRHLELGARVFYYTKRSHNGPLQCRSHRLIGRTVLMRTTATRATPRRPAPLLIYRLVTHLEFSMRVTSPPSRTTSRRYETRVGLKAVPPPAVKRPGRANDTKQRTPKLHAPVVCADHQKHNKFHTQIPHFQSINVVKNNMSQKTVCLSLQSRWRKFISGS